MNSREKLLKATRECLLHLGHGATTVKAIASRAGVNHGLVHHYFGSKESLIVEVLVHEQQELLSQVARHPVEEKLGVIVRELVENNERSRLLVEFLAMADQMPEAGIKIREALAKRDELFCQQLGIEDVGIRWLLASALLGLALTRQVEPDAPTEQVIEQVRKIIRAARGAQ